MTAGNSSTKEAEFYKFDIGNLSDDLFHAETPVEKWLATCQTTTDKSGFPPNSLNKIYPLEWEVEMERVVGIALYMILNLVPFLLVPFVLLYFVVATWWARAVVLGVLSYVIVLGVVQTMYFTPTFMKKHKQDFYLQSKSDLDYRRNQYVFTERNISKYLSMSFVWPRSLHRPAYKDQPLIFCIVPHAVAPLGITAYPLWSKLFNSHLCRWTCAPVVLKIPIIGYLVRKIGYIPAKSQNIIETLTKRQENVGVILDGIAGMFHQSIHEETAVLKQRKGIVKIALKAGAPIVPVYGFGHTAMYTVVVDPFGIMEKLSIALQASFTPFFGRWGWFLGPPKRVPVTVCLGEPVVCPQMDNPTQADIDLYHGKMLQAYQELFNKHKVAYGWGDKHLKFV